MCKPGVEAVTARFTGRIRTITERHRMQNKEHTYMTIEQTRNENTLTVALAGRLDTTTAPELEEALFGALDGVEELILDLEALDYISSAGLRVLLSVQKRMNRQGSMKVRNVNEMIAEIFEVTGFSDILTVE